MEGSIKTAGVNDSLAVDWQSNEHVIENNKDSQHLMNNVCVDDKEKNSVKEKGSTSSNMQNKNVLVVNIHSTLEDGLKQYMDERYNRDKKEKQYEYKKTGQNFNPLATSYSEISISTSDIKDRYNMENEENNERQKCLRERFFSPFTPGGVRLSTVLFICTAVGVGILSIPFAFSKLGIIFSFVLIMLNAIESYITTNIICLSSLEYNVYVYGNLVKKFGSVHKCIIDISLTLCFFATYILSLIVICKSIITIFEVLNFPSFFMNKTFLTTVICVLVIPIGSQKKISGPVSYFMILSVISILATIIIISVQTQFYYNNLPEEQKHIFLFNIDRNFFKCFNILLFAFSQQPNACFITGQFHRPTNKRIRKSTYRSIVLQIIVYSLIGTLGYISFSGLTEEIIVLNYENSNVPMLICKCFLSISFFLTVPLNYMGAYQSARALLLYFKQFCCKIFFFFFRRNTNRTTETLLNNSQENTFDRPENFSREIDGNEERTHDDSHQFSKKQKFLVCVIVSFLSAVISLNVEHSSNVIGICGGLASTLINCLLPNLIYFKNRRQIKNKVKRYLTLCFLCCFSFMGLFSTAMTTYISWTT